MNAKDLYKAGQAGMLNSICKFLLAFHVNGKMTKDEFEQRFLLVAFAFQSARDYTANIPTREIKAIASNLESDCSSLVEKIPFQFGSGGEYLALANEYIMNVAEMAGMSAEQYAAFIETSQ
jgi:hypothetical protein